MPQLYLIRHGESANNALVGESPRTADPCLTQTGQAQAKSIAAHLKHEQDRTDVRDGLVGEGGYGIGRLYCSAMLRALQTAQPIGAALGLAPQVWLEVHEGGGMWLDHQDGRGRVGHPGLTRSEMERQFAGFKIPDGVTDCGWCNRSSERGEQLSARAAQVAGNIRDMPPRAEERIAIVSHGGFLNLLIQHLLFGRHVQGCFFSCHNTGFSRLDFNEGRLMVRYLNRVDHLSKDLVT